MQFDGFGYAWTPLSRAGMYYVVIDNARSPGPSPAPAPLLGAVSDAVAAVSRAVQIGIPLED